MTKEDEKLLIEDLRSRRRYGVKILFNKTDYDVVCDDDLMDYQEYQFVDVVSYVDPHDGTCTLRDGVTYVNLENLKPYLRDMNSMDEEEKETYRQLCEGAGGKNATQRTMKRITWLNKNFFDYRGLIKKGLAISVPKWLYS